VAGGCLVRKSGKETSRSCSGMVVGLGGGGLPVFLQKYLGMSVTAVELDPDVVTLASRHFCCQNSDVLEVSSPPPPSTGQIFSMYTHEFSSLLEPESRHHQSSWTESMINFVNQSGLKTEVSDLPLGRYL
jgi:hypothetical protein